MTDDRENLRGRRQVVTAVLLGADRAATVLEVVATAKGDDDAVLHALAVELRIDEFQARCIFEMQIRRFTPLRVEQARNELAEIDRALADLDDA